MNYSEILKISNEIKDKIISHRRVIHGFAETGFETFKTADYIRKELTSLGLRCYSACKNSVYTEISGNAGGKTFLLRCDIDALPIAETTELEFSAKNGCMHACGHDMHAAMLLGCAEVLTKLKEHFNGKAILLFQPAEELLQGAKAVLDSGFNAESIDGAMTLHVISPASQETGHVILPQGGIDAPSADFFKVTVNGTGCHGSSPWLGKDAIACACSIINSLDTVSAKEVNAYSPFTLTVTSINGGSSYNVLPQKAEFCGSMRCYDENVRKYVKGRIEEICSCISSAYRCSSSIVFNSGCPSLVISKELCDRFQKVLSEVLGENKITRISQEQSGDLKGSEDFAYFSQVIPSFTAAIPAGYCKDSRYSYQMHSQNVLFDEEALEVGCSVFAICALNFLM